MGKEISDQLRRYKIFIKNDLTTHLMPSIWHASRLAEIEHNHVAWV